MGLESITKDWLSKYPKPLLIAGPCSAETPTQVATTAQEIQEKVKGVQIFRAGIWKPRTKPNGFEGVGGTGLPWLQQVSKDQNLITATEVANANHVDLALKAGIDILWIGARTTTNPFAVQEIADALEGVSIPVLIKNPVNPDLALWIGAFERLANANVTQLGAVHRGFSTYKKSKYRNEPHWQIPLDFMSLYPTIPMLIDPSHICGRRDTLLEVAQQAFRLGYDGMMIETHCDPDKAWSDAKQQITPAQLAELLQKIKTPEKPCTQLKAELERHRIAMSELDDQIVDLLARRLELSREIADVKNLTNAALYQPERWKEVQQAATDRAEELGISKDFIQRLYKNIHEHSIEVQHNHLNKLNS